MLALKELIVVMFLSLGVFKLARPVAEAFCPKNDFTRRCNTWLALTVTVFLAPNFWVFLFVAAFLLIRLGKLDSNPAASYLFLLFVLPPIAVRVPMVGISFLINLDFHLLASFCLLAPAAWRLRKDSKNARTSSLKTVDSILLVYCVLTSFLFVQPEIARGVLMETTFTDCLRRVVVFFFSLFIPYYVISRTSYSRAAIQDMIASFSIKCIVLAAVATFEGARHWLLYGELLSRWGSASAAYISRGGEVRAMASTGHPLALGYLLAVALGFWIYLLAGVQSRVTRWVVTALFCLGLLSDYSRGPWAGAIVIYFAFLALGPKALSRLLKAAAGILLLGTVVAFSPLGAKIASVIPYFGGTVDLENVVYRQKLFARSWQIIMVHPWFGDQEALLKMEELRQGEGIIDLINGFITILLNNGFVGLFLFLIFILKPAAAAFRVSAETSRSDPDCSALGASLIACMVGSLLMMWVGGLIDMMTCVLVGLMSAYVGANRPLRAEAPFLGRLSDRMENVKR